jgi:hypothetical protein
MNANRRTGSGRGRRGVTPADRKQMHADWLSLVEVTGPFLSIPVLVNAWPDLEALDGAMRDRLRFAHGEWQADPAAGKMAWIEFVLRELLGWADALHTDELDGLALDIAEHDTTVTPSFALIEPDGKVEANSCRLLGLVCDDMPTNRIKGSAWAATPVDRLAQLCRHHGVELGLATDGRWWSLVWAPRGGVTTTATVDAITWPEAAERDVVRAFLSLLERRRFFAVADDVQLPALLRASLNSQEEITDRLGVQVRQAVELLVAAIGRADAHDRDHGDVGLSDITAHEVYHGAVTVMMRIVFLLFAEERGLLPADNELYARAYSAGRLYEELEHRVQDAGGNEGELEHTFIAWHRLLALFTAIYRGVDHPQLQMAAHDGSIFDPDAFAWLEGRTPGSPEPGRPLPVDDRTVLHMLRSVQHVVIGKELRRVSFRTLDVEQIGYVYEGLLSFEGFRAADTVVGLIGKEGQENEVSLTELERLAAPAADVPALAETLHETYKDSRIGSPRALAKALTPLPDDQRQVAETKLYAVTKDHTLVQRLLPFYGIIRRDLRDDPVVILPGALYVTESKLRKNTGTHYTPRFLAEQIVEGALEPLVYSPGPLQTADRNDWKLKASTGILALKVADIAMGSAAFLVAACRYLADCLIEAWSAEGDHRARTYLDSDLITEAVDIDGDPLVIEARRLVIEHCLYGVDINPMAVEMAKLSLWLVSMDTSRPFTFLDDRLVAGDSLLGITSLDQLEVMHLDAKKGRKIHERALLDFTAGVRALVADVAAERRLLADIHGDDIPALTEKRRLLADVRKKTERAQLLGNLTVGAALAHVERGDRGLRDGSIAAADHARRITSGSSEAVKDARDTTQDWLATDQPEGSFDRETLHWPLVFPEVFESGGFDAIVGNPPFLGGQKLTTAVGTAYREYLVELVGGGARGSADLIAYFVLRAHGLLSGKGQTGLIATNTLAQGDTREVGLDQAVANGTEIRQSIKSRSWPSRSAVLEYCAVWTSRTILDEDAVHRADDVIVPGITTSLDPVSRVTGPPYRLAANLGISFQGSNILGLGFTMEPSRAEALIEKNPRNAEVLFPYLNGQDLNSRPDCSGSRWVINFHDWPEEKARTYPDCYTQVSQLVKPERANNKDERRREIWWRFTRPTPDLYRAISGLDRAIVITLHAKVVMPVMTSTGQVFSHALAVFATEDPAMLAMLSSAPHYWWAISWASTIKGDLRYTPSDVFETLPRPELTGELRSLGERLDSSRRELMIARQAGLTKTYNLVHDRGCQDSDIVELREIHKAIDEAVVRAYGWNDLLHQGLDHKVYDTRQGTRYAICPVARQEILDRLLELNHERYAKEVAAGLHGKSGEKSGHVQDGLFS